MPASSRTAPWAVKKKPPRAWWCAALILPGQPITNDLIVHADAAGFMAAMLSPGMRAVSITISARSGAGGFVLPNDRIDVIQTRKVGQAGDLQNHTLQRARVGGGSDLRPGKRYQDRYRQNRDGRSDARTGRDADRRPRWRPTVAGRCVRWPRTKRWPTVRRAARDPGAGLSTVPWPSSVTV